jgi:hypothetical protein
MYIEGCAAIAVDPLVLPPRGAVYSLCLAAVVGFLDGYNVGFAAIL